MKTCKRDALICGTPAWRYIYHTIHSCDKWFINPVKHNEPWLHGVNLDKVDEKCDKVLSDKELFEYFEYVKEKTLRYLGELNDDNLLERPENCEFTCFELILGQFRHFMCHIGILNGITIATEGKYPRVRGLSDWRVDASKGKLYEE